MLMAGENRRYKSRDVLTPKAIGALDSGRWSVQLMSMIKCIESSCSDHHFIFYIPGAIGWGKWEGRIVLEIEKGKPKKRGCRRSLEARDCEVGHCREHGERVL